MRRWIAALAARPRRHLGRLRRGRAAVSATATVAATLRRTAIGRAATRTVASRLFSGRDGKRRCAPVGTEDRRELAVIWPAKAAGGDLPAQQLKATPQAAVN